MAVPARCLAFGYALQDGAAGGGGLGCLAPPGALRIRYPQRYPSRGISM